MRSDYRHGSLEARPGLATREGSWHQYTWTPEPAQEPQYCSVFRHGWSDRCALSRSCFKECDNRCDPMVSDELVHESRKSRRNNRFSHAIIVRPWSEDSWEGEQAEQTLSKLDDLVNGYGGGWEKHRLFWPHPRYRFEELQEKRTKGKRFFLLVSLCLFGYILALEFVRRHISLLK